jgi:hypothetical protein
MAPKRILTNPAQALRSVEPPSKATKRKTIRWITDFHPINHLFDCIVQAVLTAKRFFNRLGHLVYVTDGGVETLSSQNFSGLLSSLVEIEALHQQKGGALVSGGYCLLPARHATAFLTSPTVIDQFPLLTHYAHSPLFDRDWNLISTPGYDARSGIYYCGTWVQPATNTTVLDRVLADFCWKSPVDRVNYLGLLITGVTILHSPGTHPAAMFNANQTGAGKSTLARCMGWLLHGGCHSVSYTSDDAEFEKQIATRVSAGDRVILIDNAKHSQRVREVSSAVLERSITDPVLNYRRLGSNTPIRRPNDVIFGITMNDAKLSVDLTRRCMPINLEAHGNVRARRFAHDDIDAFVRDHRWEMLGELLGLVVRWLDAGRPEPDQPARHSIGQRWATTTDAILRHAGLVGFLDNMSEAERAFDADYDALTELCAGSTKGPMPAAGWVGIANQNGLFRDRLCDDAGYPKTERAAATLLGVLLNRFVGTTFEIEAGTFVLTSSRPPGGHGSVAYTFVRQPEEPSRE